MATYIPSIVVLSNPHSATQCRTALIAAWVVCAPGSSSQIGFFSKKDVLA